MNKHEQDHKKQNCGIHLWEARLAAIMHRMCGISQRAHGCAVRLFQLSTARQLCGAIVSVEHCAPIVRRDCSVFAKCQEFAARRASHKRVVTALPHENRQ